MQPSPSSTARYHRAACPRAANTCGVRLTLTFRLETPRLWLRWPTHADADALQAIASLEVVARQTATWPHPFPEAEALRRIERVREANAAGRSWQLAVALKRRPEVLIGLVGLHPVAADGALELGYMLAVEHQGYGIMTEAVRAIATAAFRFTGVRVVRGMSGLSNHASRRVMEKAGFVHAGRTKRDAPARGGAVPCDALELTRAHWRGQRTAAIKPLRETSRSPEIEMPCGRAA